MSKTIRASIGANPRRNTRQLTTQAGRDSAAEMLFDDDPVLIRSGRARNAIMDAREVLEAQEDAATWAMQARIDEHAWWEAS